jgi:glutamyl-tRNA synthetase
MAEPVRVRFAPSPTGHLHVGSARTALFNWAFARRHKGVFILRIEDTDRSRSTEEYLGSVLDALQWLGLDWDEGPPTAGYRQTERMDVYRAHAERLLAEGRAYRCRCTPETLDALRKEAQARQATFRYPGTCRAASVSASEPHALRLRVPDEGQTVVEDAIHGAVTFDHAAQLDDWILVRTDGTPTYNFCVVVDDVTMKITHVIRGDDHLSNTPKQIQCYRALGYPTPVFAHIPLILGADKSRLSKRHGATSVNAYADQGFLPEAMVNYLARLGWSHGDQEVFTKDEIAAHFDLAHVGLAAAVFDHTKLEWLSQQWIKALPGDRLARALAPFLERAGLPVPDLDWLAPAVDTLRERAKTLVEMAEAGAFYLRPPTAYDAAAIAKFWGPEAPARYTLLIRRLEGQAEWEATALELVGRGLAAELGVKLVDVAQLARIAVTGRTASPPIFQVMALLGREESFRRLRAAKAAAETRA